MDSFQGLHNKKIFRKLLFLIINPTNLTTEQKDTFLSETRKQFPEKHFQIWGPHELDPLIEQFAEYSGEIKKVPFIYNKVLENIVTKSLNRKAWRIDRDHRITNLKSAYINSRIVLFLGAGVSRSADLPDWNTLLSKLLISLVTKKLHTNNNTLQDDIALSEKEKIIIVNALRSLNNSSFLIEARYISSGLGEDFIHEVKRALYPEKIKDSPLLKTIAKLCVPRKNNYGVNAIITYNFDDLLEYELIEANIQHKSISRDNDNSEHTELEIYHVHGFLPRKLYPNSNLENERIIFSEQQYHELMLDPYDWANLIQLKYLKENTCVLIGLSGTDPNLRRILELVKGKTKKSKHYILFERVSNDFFQRNLSQENINDQVINTISDIHHSLVEASFEDLGIKIIWYKTKDEIQELLDKIRE